MALSKHNITTANPDSSNPPLSQEMAGQKRSFDVSCWGNEMVRFIVGTEEREATVHKGLLLNRINHFETHFRHGFKESHTKTIRLEDVRPEVFKIIFRWLYGDGSLRPLEPPSKKVPLIEVLVDSQCYRQEGLYHDIIYTAESWGCKELLTVASQHIAEYHIRNCRPIHPQLLTDGLKNLPKSSRFRQWMIKLTAAFILLGPGFSGPWFKRFREVCDDESLHDDLNKEMFDSISKMDCLKRNLKLESEISRITLEKDGGVAQINVPKVVK